MFEKDSNGNFSRILHRVLRTDDDILYEDIPEFIDAEIGLKKGCFTETYLDDLEENTYKSVLNIIKKRDIIARAVIESKVKKSKVNFEGPLRVYDTKITLTPSDFKIIKKQCGL